MYQARVGSMERRKKVKINPEGFLLGSAKKV